MTPFAFFLSASILIAGLMIFSVGSFVLIKSRQPLNFCYFLMSLSILLGAFGSASRYAAPNLATAEISIIFWIVGWAAFFPLWVIFAQIFAKIKIKTGNVFVYYIPWIITAVIVVSTPWYISGYKEMIWGYEIVTGPWFRYWFALWVIYVLIGLFYVYGVYNRGKEFYRRKQAGIFLLSAILSSFPAFFVNILLVLGIPAFEVAPFSVALVVGFMGYGILRYQPTHEVSKEGVAEAVAIMLPDPMFLTDVSNKVTYANPAASLSMNLWQDELLDRNLQEILPQIEAKESDLVRKDGSAIKVSPKVFPIAGNLGYVVLVQDLSLLNRLRQSIDWAGKELKELNEREEKILDWDIKFCELNHPAEAEELWKRIQEEEPEVQVALKPAYELVVGYARLCEEEERLGKALEEKKHKIMYLEQTLDDQQAEIKQLKKEYEGLKP